MSADFPPFRFEDVLRKDRVLLWLWAGCLWLTGVCLPLGGPWFGLTWHDQQRIGQVLLFSLVAAAMPFWRCFLPSLWPWSGKPVRWLGVILGLGILSSLLARFPVWALTEVALMVMCAALAWTVAMLRVRFPLAMDLVLLATIVFLCSALSLKFLIGYLSVVTCGFGILSPRLLLEGFSNVRFYGQFQALTLPILIWPLLAGGSLWRWRRAAGLLCAVWWAQAILAGSRGIWLGMAAALMVMAATGKAGRTWARGQMKLAAVGFLLFFLWLTVIPAWLGIQVQNHPADRDLLSLRGRSVLWTRAVRMIYQHPFLGAGPMHFADMPALDYCHPHQSVLQWGAEWGVPSGLILLGLLAGAARSTGRVLRATASSDRAEDWLRVCVAGSLVASAAQSMVDGVLVMPYTMLWLSILSGWLLGLHPAPTVSVFAPSRLGAAAGGGIVLVSTLLLLMVVVRDAPGLEQRNQEFYQIYPTVLRPRFWTQGFLNLEDHKALMQSKKVVE